MRGIITVRCVLFTVFSFSPLLVSAQTYIFGRADFSTGLEPQALAVGDFNGDGKPDLVVTNSTDNTISVLMGKPDGTFSPKADYQTGIRPVSVVVADFNGDGNLDLAVTNENCVFTHPGVLNCGPGTVSIFLGNGDGTFQVRADYATGKEPLSVAAGDFNGDGKIDLVVADTQDNSLSVLFGNGDGTFQPQTVLASPSESPQCLVVADFNGDSKLDVAVISGAAGVSILLGKGDGTFQVGWQFNSQAQQGQIVTVSALAGDFNNDGRLDLVTATSGGLSVFLAQSDGTFVLNGNYPGGSWVVAADFNNDGKLDLASSSGSSSVVVLLGNGDGTFQGPTGYGTASISGALAVADFNGDGKVDLAVTNPGCTSVEVVCGSPGSSATILLGIGDGTFMGQRGFGVDRGPLDVIAADFNGDGKLDLATANQGADNVSILLGNGDGTFGSSTTFSTGNSPVALSYADFRGNGKTDLAVVDQNCSNGGCVTGAVSILLGNGDGTYQPHVDYPVRVDPLSLAIGDVNGDGKPDIAITNSASNTVSILLGNGDGTFKPAVDYATTSGPGAVTVADFNGDGKLDLAVAGNAVSILLGNGDGTFQPHVDIAVAALPSILAADFNGDGKVDLAVGVDAPVGVGATVSILLGNGDGTFATGVVYPSGGSQAGTLHVGDFNGDGKPDLAVTIPFTTTAAVLLGNGDGTFQKPIPYFVGGNSLSSSTVGDFNGDGISDLVGADANTWSVGVLSSTPFRAVYPAAVNFASQGVGTTSPVQAITLSNPSHVKFGFGGATVTGDFAETNTCGASLAQEAHCTISVQFSPTALGTRSGRLTLTDTTRTSPQIIPLTGNGVNGPFLASSVAKLSLPPTAIGSTTSSQPITIFNSGNATLNIMSIGITGANSTDFSESNSCGASLSAGQTCTFSVTFQPTAGGKRTATIAIADNAPGSPKSVTLFGTGLAPAISLSSTSLTFSSQPTGTTSGLQSITLNNTGGAALNISRISISGNFTQSNNCGSSVSPSGSCQIQFAFAPATTGTLSGTLTIASNAAGSSATVALSGVGIAPSLDFGISPGSQNSATVVAGGSASYTLVIGGGGMAGTASLTCSGGPQGASCNAPASINLSATVSSTVTVSVTTTSRVSIIPLDITWPWLWSWALAILGCVLFGLLIRSRSEKLQLSSIAALVALALLLLSCGGGSNGSTGNSHGTPSGSYTLNVTATSGTTTQSVQITLVVQ